MQTGPTLMQIENGLISQWKIVKICEQKIKSYKKSSSMFPLRAELIGSC